eukprot:4216051-Amphidinium_carterae.1
MQTSIFETTHQHPPQDRTSTLKQPVWVRLRVIWFRLLVSGGGRPCWRASLLHMVPVTLAAYDLLEKTFKCI